MPELFFALLVFSGRLRHLLAISSIKVVVARLR